MRKRSILFTCSSALLALAVWTACTGDDPTVTPTGGLAQPCSTGDTCNTPDLRCADGFCRLIGTASADGGGTSSGNTSSSSSGNVPSDANIDADAPPTDAGDGGDGDAPQPACRKMTTIDGGDSNIRIPDAGVPCPLGDGGTLHCASGTYCCPGEGCSATTTCPSGNDAWECLTTSACTNSNDCHVSKATWLRDGGTCGTTVRADRQQGAPPHERGSRCIGYSADYIQLCTHEEQCGIYKCEPISIVVNGITMVVGACTD